MRVVIVCVDKGSSPVCGTDRYTANLVKLLLSHGHEVRVLAHKHNNLRHFLSKGETGAVRWQEYQPPHWFDGGLAVVLWHLFVLPFRLAAIGADVAHVTNGRPALCRCFLTLHDVTELTVPKKYDQARLIYRRLLLYPIVRRKLPLLTGSELAKADIVRELRIPADRVRVIPHIAFERAVEAAGAFATQVAVQPFILYVGRIDHPSKNLLVLVEAFEAVHRRIPGCRLVLAGSDSWGAAAVHDRVKRSPAAAQIVFRGFVPEGELVQLQSAAAVLCLPSRHEGFGLPVIEAIRQGLPVLASDEGAPPEVLNGIGCLSADDASEWTSALIDLLTSPQRRSKLLAAQTDAIGRKYDPDHVYPLVMDVYVGDDEP